MLTFMLENFSSKRVDGARSAGSRLMIGKGQCRRCSERTEDGRKNASTGLRISTLRDDWGSSRCLRVLLCGAHQFGAVFEFLR